MLEDEQNTLQYVTGIANKFHDNSGSERKEEIRAEQKTRAGEGSVESARCACGFHLGNLTAPGHEIAGLLAVTLAFLPVLRSSIEYQRL